MSEQNSGEKTEKATPRKRRQARENAQVLKSHELIAAASLLVMFAVLSGFGAQMVGNLRGLFTQYLGIADA
jgi:flagellar biosynthetic protein FlhB